MFILFKSAGVPYLVNLKSCLLGAKMVETKTLSTISIGNKEFITDLSTAEKFKDEEAERAFLVYETAFQNWRKLVDTTKI